MRDSYFLRYSTQFFGGMIWDSYLDYIPSWMEERRREGEKSCVVINLTLDPMSACAVLPNSMFYRFSHNEIGKICIILCHLNEI